MAKVIESLPGADALGHSYNVFDLYANPRSVRKELFNMGAIETVSVDGISGLLSKDIVCHSTSDITMKTVCGRTKDAYSSELAASAKVSGSYGLFSASVETDCKAGWSEQSNSTYTSILVNVNKWKLRLRDDVESLRSKKTASFKRAVETMEPMELFEAYGTHFLYELLVGGRANFTATTKSSEFESDDSIKVAAEAAYGCLAKGAKASMSVEMKKKVEHFNSNSSVQMYAMGGNAHNALYAINDPDEFSSWVRSIAKGPIFCGFTPDSLVPLWQLADTPHRRETLRAATGTYLPATMTRNAIVDVDVIVSSNYQVNPPHGYKKIEYDLNSGAGGKYIFLCYKQESIHVRESSADPKPITNLHVAAGNSWAVEVPPGYTKIEVDLNMGAGGKFIFLCYTKDPEKAEGGLPIRGVTVIGNKNNSNTVTPYGFERIGVDLNWEAKGDFIYLCFSRHLD